MNIPNNGAFEQQKEYSNGKLPPPIHGTFVGGSKPPGGGFAKFEHLDKRYHQYDGKALRKAVQRRTVDYQSTVINYLERRHIFTSADVAIQRRKHFILEYSPVFSRENPAEAICTKLVNSCVNKIRCPINCVAWTPEGRRLITGSTSGEFTLWNGTMFNFETILQAHDSAVRSMVWSHSDNWLISSDHTGVLKYWEPNLNNVKAFQAHREPIRGLTLSPSDAKIATGSDDSTIKIWDFAEAREERTLTGHGWDVKILDWHPYKGLLASGGKDNLIKLWDPRTGGDLTTLHGHKNTIMGLSWNKNGHWLLAGSRDQLLRIYDIRTMKELGSYKGHKKEVNCLQWHPFHTDLFASGGADGSVYFWQTNNSSPIGALESAHDSNVWSLDWHPFGHILASGSNDHATRFWTRNRPCDELDDDYVRGKPFVADNANQRYHPYQQQQHMQRGNYRGNLNQRNQRY